MSAADGMITAGRALGAGEIPGPVFSSPFQVIVFLACCECAALKKLAPRRLQQQLLLLLLLLLFAPFVVRSPFLFAVVWTLPGGVALVMAVVLVQCASGQVIKDVDGDGIDDLTVAKK